MANKFQVKRTSISGRTPNTTNSGNTHFIDTGELALNLTDGKMFSSNGSVSFEIGANLQNQSISNTLTVKAISANGSNGTSGQVLKSNGSSTYWGADGADVGAANQLLYRDSSNVLTTSSGLQYDGTSIKVNGNLESVYQNGDEGGEIFLNKPVTSTSITNGVTIDVFQNKLRIFENGGTNRGAFIDITAATGGVGSNLLAGGGSGTVSQVNTGNGLTGGPITSTGTISVLANTGMIANATGLYVNSSYIATLAANSATYLGGNTASDLRSYSDTQASAAYSNATAFATNADNISSGTLNASRLPATAVQNTDSRTLSGNLVISGTYFNPSANTILLGNSTQRWVLSANTGSFSGAVSGITTLAAGNTTVTGFVNATSSIQGGGSLTIAGAASGITTLAAGNTTITGFANVTSTIQGGSSLTIAGALSGVTTAAMGNTTITGFANASVSVNSALLTVGTSFIANTTGAYHTGTVNAASYTTTGIVANTSGVYPTSNTVGTALGTTTNRWNLAANAASFTGQVEVRDTWDTATGNGAIYLDGATGNRIDWNVNGVAAPAVTTRSAGTKLVLYPAVAASAVDFGIGIETDHMWLSASDTGGGIKLYANTTQLAVANTTGVTVGSGGLFPTSNSTATSLGSATQRWVLNANTGSFAGAVSGITTLAAGNTTITGFANASVSVNSALLTVGTSFIANTTGAYHTGLVNAASLNIGGSGFIANSTAIVLAEPVTANGTTGTSGQVLTSNGTTGSPYWTTVSAGLSIGGSNTQVQYNNSGALGGDLLFTFDQSTDVLSVGNNTSGSYNLGFATPSTSRGIQAQKIYASDTSPAGVYIDVTRNNATLTAARSVVGIQALTVSNTADANSTGGIQGSDGYGIYGAMYNGELVTDNARINNMYAGYFVARNYAGGATANTVDAAHGGYFNVGVYGSGNITTAYGTRVLISPANTTAAGGITTAYGHFANIQSNTASAIANAYMYYGVYNGTNFTGTAKFGIYITGESNNYVSGNFAIGGNATAAVFSATSDERLKTNINIIEEPLEKIQKIRGVTFNYKANDNPGVGVIAQDIDQIFPELVSINSEGYKSVVYDGLIGLLIESIKNQQKQIDVLSSKVDLLLQNKV